MERSSVLVALGTGIVCGSDVLKLWNFDDMLLTNQCANLALVFILFHGGFMTRYTDFRAVALPAGGLATRGVLLTAAATLSILRCQSLPKKISSTVEIESAANDPMAILLTTLVVESLASGTPLQLSSAGLFLWKFGAGPVFGFIAGRLTLALLYWLKPQDRGYYYLLFIGMVMLTYGLAEAACWRYSPPDS